MRDVSTILHQRAELLAKKYLSTIDAGTHDTAGDLPIEEVLGLAAKLKRLHLDRSGESRTIEREAARAYEATLREMHPALYLEYCAAKQPGASKALKATVFAKINQVLPDTTIKTRYIENRLALDTIHDRGFLLQAAWDIGRHRAATEIENLKRNVRDVGAGASIFQRYLNLVSYLDQTAVSILFRRQLHKALGASYSGRAIRVLFYKCLRLTHERGEVGFYAGLDDHAGIDKNGRPVTFLSKAELHQLDAIKNVVRALSESGLSSRNTVIVCDYDLLKFEGYEVPRDRLMTYVSHVADYLRGNEVGVTLETEFFGCAEFGHHFATIAKSVACGDGRFINPQEFERVESDYFDHYSQTMKTWDAGSNHHYAIRSVSRNIAEGAHLSREDTVVFVFNDSLVNGERFNLATKKKVPFVGLRKARLKQRDGA